MTVMGFHYALDAHPTLGNNAQIISKLGAKITGSLFDEWGFAAEFENPIDITILKKKCEALFHRDILHVEGNSKVIQKIGVVSGAAKPHDENIVELHENGIQLYISGETSESRIHVMKEEGIHYFVCGHYSTEIFGVQALGEEIKKEFGDDVVVEFIDVPNPV